MSLNEDIRRAQIDAGERAVMASLAGKGLSAELDLRPLRHVRTYEELKLAEFKRRAMNVVGEAYAAGFVITVSTEPVAPLAMGNYRLEVDVRDRRNFDPLTPGG